MLITFPWVDNGVPVDADSVTLCDDAGNPPGNSATYGVRRTDNNAIVVAVNTAMTRVALGQYSLWFDDPADSLTYEYFVKVVYGGTTYFIHRTQDGPSVLSSDSINLQLVVISGGVLTALNSTPSLKNPAGTYGVSRIDTSEVVVPADTAMVVDMAGSYHYAFTPSEKGLKFSYYIYAVLAGKTYYLPRTTNYISSAAIVVGRYTDLYNIETQFGVDNVHKWLGINENDQAVDYAMRAYEFIKRVESEIDDNLRNGSSTVPFGQNSEAIPDFITQLATTLAAVRMYESRGVMDADPITGKPMHRLQFQANWVTQQLKRMRVDDVQLPTTDTDGITQYPVVMCDDPPKQYREYPQMDFNKTYYIPPDFHVETNWPNGCN